MGKETTKKTNFIKIKVKEIQKRFNENTLGQRKKINEKDIKFTKDLKLFNDDAKSISENKYEFYNNGSTINEKVNEDLNLIENKSKSISVESKELKDENDKNRESTLKRFLKKISRKINVKNIVEFILNKYTENTVPNTIFDVISAKKLKILFNAISCGYYFFNNKSKALASAVLSCISILEIDK